LLRSSSGRRPPQGSRLQSGARVRSEQLSQFDPCHPERLSCPGKPCTSLPLASRFADRWPEWHRPRSGPAASMRRTRIPPAARRRMSSATRSGGRTRSYRNLERVQLCCALPEHGLERGAWGTIVHVFEPAEAFPRRVRQPSLWQHSRSPNSRPTSSPRLRDHSGNFR
jgi:hypothetical protein